MKIIVLTVGVEISDQYGTSKMEIVDVFNKGSENIIELIEAAKERTKSKYRKQRTFFKESEHDLIK